MTANRQLQWGGLWIILVSFLMNSTNIAMYLGWHSITIQAMYGIGFAGLILACSIIHFVQARQAGVVGSLAYLVTVLGLIYANIAAFLTLAELAGFREASDALVAFWEVLPVTRFGVYASTIGLILLGYSIASAGVLPRWGGIFLTLGVALQVPARFATELAGPLFSIPAIGGSMLFGAGLVWIGWALWSGRGHNTIEPGLSNPDRIWGGPVLIFAGLMLAIDAMVNMFGGLSLTSGTTHLVSSTAGVLTAFVLFAAHGQRAGWTGFFGLTLTQLGATIYLTTAFLIFAQLAGTIDNNVLLMASWVDIPVGRYGQYMITLGLLLLGSEAIRTGVFPRLSGWLLVIGTAIAFAFSFSFQEYHLAIFWVLGAILQGTGLGWIGWSLLANKRASEKLVLVPVDQ